MKPQRWACHDHRTTGVIYTLAQQILTETTLLTFDHVSKRLQWTLVRPGNSSSATTVVEQSVDRLLKHTLLVTHDNVGRVQVEKTLKSVVSVDHTSVQIVEIRCRKSTAVQRNQRTKIRWKHRQCIQHHPLGAVT